MEGNTLGFVSKNQVTRARAVSVLDYVLRYESNNIKRVGSSYRLKDHDSLAISDKGFYWHSRGFGGVTVLDYLMKVRDYDFVNAVCQIVGERPFEKGDKLDYRNQNKPSKQNENIKEETNISTTPIKNYESHISQFKNISTTECQPLAIPRRNKDNFRVIAYLQNRGIDHHLIMECINRGVLYQSVIHHNAIFLGKDENGKTRFAAMRATTGNFKCDAEGSNKKYGFVIPPNNPASCDVAIFESPIDTLSYQTMCKQGHLPDFDGWYLSLGGACINALTHFIEWHPEINRCLICTDNDEAGNMIAEKIIRDISLNTERLPPVYGKDWNDSLLEVIKSEMLKNRTVQQDTPYL